MSDMDTHSRTALLVMDMQPGIVNRFAQSDAVLKPVRVAIDAAHAASIPVIYVAVAFRPGYPEISPRNKSFAAIKQQASLPAAMTATEIHPAITPQPTDIVVTKRRVSAFSGSDLEVVLRAQGITHLVLSGIATSGVVLSTLREAAAAASRRVDKTTPLVAMPESTRCVMPCALNTTSKSLPLKALTRRFVTTMSVGCGVMAG